MSGNWDYNRINVTGLLGRFSKIEHVVSMPRMELKILALVDFFLIRSRQNVVHGSSRFRRAVSGDAQRLYI